MPRMSWDRLLCAKRNRQTTSINTADMRTEFRKDYHRIIGSASFRRLQDKTQVFPLDRGDFVRTRLTHSLETSSFAESVGDIAFRKLEEKGYREITPEVRFGCCDILRCAGLVHDIGNPPFGHFGEYTIREWFSVNLPQLTYKSKPLTELLSAQMKGDFLNFEGNAQALRLLAKLHYLVDEHGMNLTYALLNTIIKYPVSSVNTDKKSGDIKTKKMGYFLAEEELYKSVASETGANDFRYPLTFLLEAADDIAYKTADIEDAVKKGLVSYEKLYQELKTATEKCESESERETLSYALKRLIHCRKRAEERNMPDPSQNAVQNWVISMQTLMLNAAADSFVDNYEQIMNGCMKTELLSSSPARGLSAVLSDIAFRYAFLSKEILKLELSVENMMDFLLKRLTGAALRYKTAEERITDGKLISVISENYVKLCRMQCEGADDAHQAYYRLMLVTDYICGMTDGFARQLYREISGIS